MMKLNSLSLSLSQCSREDIGEKLRKPKGLEAAVHISNPKTLEFQVCLQIYVPLIYSNGFSLLGCANNFGAGTSQNAARQQEMSSAFEDL